jgi:hypothetical protein
MLFPANIVVADGVLVTAISASVAKATVVIALAELFVLTGSLVVVETLTVSVIFVPRTTPALILVVNVIVTGIPTATVPTLQVIVPAMIPQLAPVAETNVVFAGTASVSTTPCASLGPRSVITCEHTMLLLTL